ncbi:hypothetical protein fugu_019970 [Takifugu bimaculatus]|uniref:Uncharacterized protein n=1 Tax=Takifugu bimaculatus TaxID=433685 RepID=A0A4Z2BK65_9TELE|nr:hypothetical protein fugu_019970 [Takifugu bimaculatus]
MTEEFDEDVVFENSPLFQYLHDLGHTDFETCPIASQEEEYIDPEGDLTNPDNNPPKTLGGRFWRLAETLWTWSPIHQAAATRKLGQQLDSVFGQYSVRCILDQDVLLQEDVELIELLDPSLLTLSSSPSWIARSSKCSTQTKLHSQALFMGHSRADWPGSSAAGSLYHSWGPVVPGYSPMLLGSAGLGGAERGHALETWFHAESHPHPGHTSPDARPQWKDSDWAISQSSAPGAGDRGHLQRFHPGECGQLL